MKTCKKIKSLIKTTEKYLERKLKAVIVMFAAVIIMLLLMPIDVFADESDNHTTHEGYMAISMGTEYICIDGVEQTSNMLSDGKYYLTGDITKTLNINGDVSLCLNGYSVNANSGYGIYFYKNSASLTIDDCVGTGEISGSESGINIDGSSATLTVNGGTIGSSSTYGIYSRKISDELFINGGNIIGIRYGIYNDYSSSKVYLSGGPAVSGGNADIYGGVLYADNNDGSNADSCVPYSGEALTLEYGAYPNPYHGDTMVYHVNETNKNLFALSDDITNFSLTYDSDNNALKFNGAIMSVTWYAEDGTTVLNGADYPTEMHYREVLKFSVLPDYEKEGYIFRGWSLREKGTDVWSEELYDKYDIYTFVVPTEFKANVISKNLFEGGGTADSPYLIQDIDDLLNLAQVVNDNYEYYNANTVYYKLTTDIDLSSVCGEDKGNWTPIGKSGFKAQFDGDGHAVSNLYCVENSTRIGLFAYITGNASIRNLAVTGYVSGSDKFSGVVGENKGTIENCLDMTRNVPYGYTSDEYGWMTYKSYSDASVDVKAIYNGNWIKTSYDSSKQYQIKTEGLSGAAITVTPSIINGGSYIKVLYTVTNNSSDYITGGKLAVHSDIQIGSNDMAAIELIFNSSGKPIGLRMIDNDERNLSYGAHLNLYFAGMGGVTDADTYWFGYYRNRENNAFVTISDDTVNSSYIDKYEKDANGNYIKLSNLDSGIAFSWQNIELAAGETKEFSWVINVGVEANPPQWGDPSVKLNVTTDADVQSDKINVIAKVKDDEGTIDKLYYSVNGKSNVMLGGVIADGVTEKNITGIIGISGWADGVYNLDFWVVNNKGAVSENVRRTITITDGRITGDINEVALETSHDWSPDWSYDETNHWHDCLNENCTISDNTRKDGFDVHTFDSDCDTTCNDCGYTRTITHTFNQKVMTEKYLASAGSCTERAKYYYSCACGEKGTSTFAGDYAPHEYQYSANGAVITETCKGGCGHSESATLHAPNNCNYDGSAKEAAVSYSAGWLGGELSVSYDSHGNINAGTVTAGITKNNVTAVLLYNIVAASATVTPPSAKENLVYDGTAKELINAGSSTSGNLQYAVGSSDTSAPESGWSTDIPERRDAGTYYVWYRIDNWINYNNADPACVAVTIAKADQASPTGVGKTDETISKKADGTITGMTAAMEYRKDGEAAYTGADSSIIANLAAGKYYIRLKGDNNHNPSAETEVTIAAGRKLKIVVPERQTGYTLTSTAYETDWLGAVTLTFATAEGYSKTENFAISLNPDSGAVWQNGQLQLSDIQNDVNIVVDGVADITAPAAEIKVKDYRWNSFRNVTLFSMFLRETQSAAASDIIFREAQSVTITADDKGSGINTVQYYIADRYLGYDEVSRITDWKDYNGPFELKPNNRYVVYAKAADMAGNTLYICTDELIFDNDAPVFDSIENDGVYYGDKTIRISDGDSYLITLTVDGVDVTDKISDGTYTIVADNKEHTLVATDKAGNVAEYKISVYKNYTVTYKIDGETVGTEIVGYGKEANMPDIPEREGYTAKWEAAIDEATGNVIVKAVYTKIQEIQNPDADSVQTGDINNLWLWILLMFISIGTAIFAEKSGIKRNIS